MATTLWHASPAQFDRPDCDRRSDNGHHPNSGLGLFAATAPHTYISGFGGHIYELTLADEARIVAMTVRQLMDMGANEEDRSFFEAERLRLMADHDAIALTECDGRVTQMIVLNSDLITDCQQLSAADFAAKAVPLH